MISSPKKEPIDDVYKSGKFNHLQEFTKINRKKRQSIIKPQPQNNNDKHNSINNNNFNSSKSNELSKQRRLSFYNMFPINVNEKKEEEEEKINPIVQKIINFENSFVGYIIIIILGIVGLLAYDFKNSIPNRNEQVYLIILGILTLCHIFDFVFRNIFSEKSVGTFYFKLQTFSVITFIFDFGMPIFLLFRFIFLKTINKDNKYLYSTNQEIIMYILGFFWNNHPKALMHTGWILPILCSLPRFLP